MKQNLAMLAEHIPENERKLLSISFGRIFGAIETLTLYPLPDLQMCARAPGMALVDFREAMTADHMLANSVSINYIYSMLNPIRLVDMAAQFHEEHFCYFLAGYLEERNTARGPAVFC